MSISSPGKEGQGSPGGTRDLEAILASISAGAAERDSHPSFPEDPFQRLASTGVLAIPVPDPIGEHGRRASFAEEWRLLRAVARADGSVGPCSMATSTVWNASRSLRQSHCARPSSKRSPQENYFSGCGAPIPSQGKENPLG